MKSEAKNVDEYISQLSNERKSTIKLLRKTIIDNLPIGFEECMNYGMIGYVVPHRLFPSGYHCSPELPLPFINLASQKNFIAFYHMGIYADNDLLEWFKNEYPKYTNYKLDMGKSCIRFKKLDHIPYQLIAELIRKVSVEKYINIYQSMINK